MKVILYKVDNDLKDIPVCTVTFDGKTVDLEGKKHIVEMLRKGIRTDKEVVKPEQGRKFLEALPDVYHGSRFYARTEAPFEKVAERIAADLSAFHEKKNYRYDPGHRRKPGPGWTPSEAGWTKPRPTQLRQFVTQGDVQPQTAPQVVTAGAYEYRYDLEHNKQPRGDGWEKTKSGWRRGKQKKEAPQQEQGKSQSDIEGTPSWKPKLPELVKMLSSDERKEWKEDEHLGHINVVLFERFADGNRAVVKPASKSKKPSELRGGMKWNDKVGQSEREAIAYELDGVLGLGVVPPSVWTRKTFPDGTKDDASVQLFVDGEPLDEISDEKKFMDEPSIKRSLMKIAVADVIFGSADRHGGNCIIGQHEAYAIDNGLSLPDSSSSIRSVPASLIMNTSRLDEIDLNKDIPNLVRAIDPDIVQHLTTIPQRDFMDVFRRHGLMKAGKAAWKRLSTFIEAAKPPKPEDIEAYQDLKKDVPIEEEEKKIHAFLEKFENLDSMFLNPRGDGADVIRVEEQMKHDKKDWEAYTLGEIKRMPVPGRAWRRGALWRENPDSEAQRISMLYFKRAKELLLNEHKYLDPTPTPPSPKPVIPAIPVPARTTKPEWSQGKIPENLGVVSSLASAVVKVAGEVLGD